jgi:hypothetical protein
MEYGDSWHKPPDGTYNTAILAAVNSNVIVS